MNKRGSAIVEAAMVFPLMVFSLIAVMYMMIYFYNQIDKRVDMHMALRAEGGEICENMFYGEMPEGYAVNRKMQQIYCYDSVSISDDGILRGRTKDIAARKYLIDEVRLVRAADLIKQRE